MRRFAFSSLPAPLRKLVKEKDPVDEDIGLYEKGRLVGVLIKPAFYRFAAEVAERAEDEIDRRTIKDYRLRRKR